ncbi:hypothetical protein D3P07_12030 [Paenibacillus sp. 1011MAR3C5]|nr:hypothetical protein D3P07_12030 [Paenibacillus sp. 1011MAR3C5]
MNYHEKIINILKTTYDLNARILESQNQEFFSDHNFTTLYEAYWISNLKIKNAIELLEVIIDN